MHEDDIAEEIRTLWQQTSAPPLSPPLDSLRADADRLHTTIRARNRRETVAGIALLLYFAASSFLPAPPLLRASHILSAAGVAFVLGYIRRHAGPRPPSSTPEACLSHYRKELEHQRDLLRRVWLWYLAPLAPGGILFAIATADVVWALIFALLFVGVGTLNQYGARSLQRELDALPSADDDLPSNGDRGPPR